jgi:tetratricopeptide (TPR) repeat protein
MRTACGLLLCLTTASAGPLEEGNRALSEGRYAEAIRCYLEAQERDGYSADILFNLGHAYAKSGAVGRAVLSYERARLLAPRDRAIRVALEEARRGARLEGDLDRGWRGFHRYLTPDEWTWLGLSAGALLLVALAGRRRLSCRALARLVGAGLLLALPASTAITKHALDRGRAIVVEAGDVRLSPYEAAEASGSVHPGQVVWITRSFDDFVMVKSPGGTAGWIARSAVEPVAP